MNIIFRLVNRYIKSLALILLVFVSFNSSAQYTVDRLGGCNNDGAGFNGTFAYCLANVPAGGTINFGIGGTFTHVDNNGCGAAASTENRWVLFNANVTIDGNGFNPIIDGSLLFEAANLWKTHVLTIAGNGFIMQNVRVTGAPDNSGNGGSAIMFGNGITDVQILNCEIDNNTGPGISHDIFVTPCPAVPLTGARLTVDNCNIHDNGSPTTAGSGIDISYFDDVTIQNCNIHDNADHGIFFNGGWGPCPGAIRGVTNSLITNNTIVDNGNVLLGANTTGGGIVLEDQSDGNTITNNNCSTNSEHGIWLREDCDNNVITGNTCNSNGYNGAGLATGVILALGGCDNNSVEGNECDANEHHGIYVYNNSGSDNTNNTIENNECTNNGEHGISIMNSTNNTIQDNFIGTDNTGVSADGNGGSGIYLRNSSNQNNIYRNIVINNVVDGLFLTEGTIDNTGTVIVNPGSCSQNNIEGNRIGIDAVGGIAGNGARGIALDNSDQNYINGTTANGPNYVSNNGDHGIQLLSSTLNEIYGNYVGVNVAGTTAMGNGIAGIDFTDSDGNFVGGGLAGQGNLISGNLNNGVTLNNSNANVFYGNIIGLDLTGTIAIANTFQGISVDLNCMNTIIGGSGANERNIISGNGQNGISLVSAGLGNIIQNNYIGLDINGTGIVPNGFHGIDVNGGTTGTVIGGNGANEGNIISGNGTPVWPSGIQLNDAHQTEVYGNIIGFDVAGNAAPNQANGVNMEGASTLNIIGGPGDSSNVISAHNGAGDYGVRITAASDNNTVQGNFIGTELTGTVARANNVGVYIEASTGNTIGGASSEFGNIISGNSDNGITIVNGDNTTISANKIGVDITGNTALANAGMGIQVTTTDGTIIGGINPGEGNVISANAGIGVQLSAATNSTMEGNMVGVGLDGTSTLGNGNVGIQLTTGSNTNIIGGNSAAARNVIAGHGGNIGIQITGATTINNTVSGNYIGIDATGAAYANNTGIQIDNGANLNSIGGLTPAEGNVISSNQTGVIINDADNNTVQMNIIGTNTTGTAGQGNVTHGVLINNGSTGNTIGTIGGVGTIAGNIISSNGNQGISLEGATTTDNYVRGNLLGTDITGTVAIPNGNHGVGITDAQNTVIGGARVEERNLISGNNQNGVGGTGDDGTIVSGNYIGTDVTGMLDLGNGAGGVSFTNSTSNIIGGSTADSINVISGNDVVGGYYFNVQNSRAEGNIIGLNALGNDTIPNYNSGFYIESGSQNNLYYSNIVSGNGHFKNSATLTPVGHGFEFVASGTNSVLYGNYVGTDITGTVAWPNSVHGVQVSNANNMIIGGTAPWQRNVISGNGGTDPNDAAQFCTGGQLKGNGISASNSADMVIVGNFIGISTNNMPLGNSENGIQLTAMTGTIIGGDGDSSNVVSSNVYKGIVMNTVTTSSVNGNLIGTDSTGLVDYGNGSGETGQIVWNGCAVGFIGGSGIIMLNSDNNMIGGAGGQRNILSGNSESGIWMQGGSDNNEIYNNYIGLDINGTSIIKNDLDGIYVVDASNNNIIGATGLGNVISGNDSSGIYIGAENWGTGVVNGITVVDNIIGLDNSGTIDLGNGNNGIEVNGAVSNVNIGTAAIGNLISGNTENGILFEGSTNTTVIAQSNIIGLNITGDDAIPNGSDGVELNASTGVQVGTTTAGNTISGNTAAGVYITNGSNTNSVFNNNIGTQVNGTDSLASTNSNAVGVLIDGGTQNSIGGVNAGESNIIATNEGDGINITDGNNDNPIRRNSFFCNIDRAIEENTSGNDKSGAPFWTSPLPPMGIETAGATDVFCFEVPTLPAGAILEIYQKGPCQDCGDSVQGQTFIDQVIADGSGNISYDFGSKIAPADYSTYIYTITEAADGLVSTSEFSPCSYQKIPPCTDPASVINTAPATICQGDSIELVAADFPTLLYTWYEASDLTTPLNGAGRVVGDNTFYVTAAGDYQVLIEDLPCDSLSAPVTITVDALQTTPDAGPNDTICISALPYTLAGNVVGDGTWVDENSVGATFTPDVNTNNAAVDNLPGDAATSLIWESRSTLGVCPVLRDTVIIQVDNLPSAAAAGPDETICETDLPATLAATAPAVGVGGWVVASGTATITDTTSATSTVSGIPAGTSAHLGWIVSNGVCPTDSQNVVINVDAAPDASAAGTDQTICETALPFALAANAPTVGTGTWTVTAGTATPDSPNSETSTVSAIPAGTSATLTWTIANGVCPDESDDVIITVDGAPDAANAGTDETLCENSLPANITANSPTVGTGVWSVSAGTATIGTNTDAATTADAIPAGTSATLTWTISNGVCPDETDDVIITVDEAPTTAAAGSDQNPCTATSTLAGNAATVGTGTWTVVAGTASVTTPNSETSGITGLVEGEINEFEWCIDNGGTCPQSCDTVVIQRLSNPLTSIAIDPVANICEGTNLSFTTTYSNEGPAPTFEWFVQNVSVQGPDNNDSFSSTTLSPGDSVYVVITGNDPCVTDNIDTNVIYPSIDAQVTADAGTDISTCGNSTTLAATVPAAGSGAWTTNGASSATATITPSTSETASVTNINPVGSPLILDWTVTNGACSDVDQVVVTSSPIPNPSVTLAGTQEVCENSSPGTFTATASDFGSGVTYQWYENGTPVGTNSSTYAVGNLSANGDVSVAITSTDACGTGLGDSTGLNITVVPLPNETITGDAFICPGVGGTISTTPAAADSYQWVLNGASNLGTGTSQAVTTGGSYTVVATNTGTGGTSCPVTSPAFVVTSATITADVFGQQNYSETVILPDDGSTEHVMVVDGNTNGTPTWTGASVSSLDATNVTDPTGTFSVGTHTLTLTGSSSGCDATATFTLIVRGPIWVPTAFSPSNNDGANDTWSPQGLDGWDEWTVNVYNRWGSLVHTQEYDGSPFVPWDGIRNGQPMPVGTYYFVVDVPGAGTFTGPLTLMR